MRGGYDLYGNYYPNLNDAMNAEMAQCNEIDNRYNQKKIKELEAKLQQPHYDEWALWQKIEELELRIKQLESNASM